MTRLALITGLAATAFGVVLASTADAQSDTPSPSGPSLDRFDPKLHSLGGPEYMREVIWELVGAGGGRGEVGLAPAWLYCSRN